jgi:hypothetical protein
MKYPDFKNSPFLNAHMKEQRNKINEQLMRQEKERATEVVKVVFAFLALMLSMYLQPELWRLIFQGY